MAAQGSRRKACVFCGATDQKMSKEHVWPEWVRHLLPPTPSAGTSSTYTFADADRGAYRRLSNRPPHDVRVRDVCEPCNTGWMNRSEEAARPVAERVMSGEGEIDIFQQKEIAFWGTLKALVAIRAMRSVNGASLVPSEDYQALQAGGETRLPPDGFLVYVAKSAWSAGQAPAGFVRLSGLHRDGSKEGDEFDGYALIFTMLDLVILVIRVFLTVPTRFVPFDDERFAASIARVWPTTPSNIAWPLPAVLSERALEALGGGSL